MSLGGSCRAAAMLCRLAARRGPAPAPRPVGGVACDWYEPRGRPRAVVVAVHGVTVQGKDDARLQGFARALAASGARCVVPTLPALAALRWETSDVDAICAVVEAATRGGAGAGGGAAIVGFSHGASLGLLAAARPGTAGRVRHVLGFGACGSLPRFFRRIRETEPPADRRVLADLAYAWLIEARRRADALGLDATWRAEADDLLARWCDAAGKAEKIAFFESRLRGLSLRSNVDPAADATFPALSPEGNLAGLACPVGLVHAPDDVLAPPSEAEALLAEVRRVAPAHAHRLLVTRLVAHVAAARVPRPGEALALLEMLAPLVEGEVPDRE